MHHLMLILYLHTYMSCFFNADIFANTNMKVYVYIYIYIFVRCIHSTAIIYTYIYMYIYVYMYIYIYKNMRKLPLPPHSKKFSDQRMTIMVGSQRAGLVSYRRPGWSRQGRVKEQPLKP